MSKTSKPFRKSILALGLALGLAGTVLAKGSLSWVYMSASHPADVCIVSSFTPLFDILSRFAAAQDSNAILNFSSRPPSGCHVIFQ